VAYARPDPVTQRRRGLEGLDGAGSDTQIGEESVGVAGGIGDCASVVERKRRGCTVELANENAADQRLLRLSGRGQALVAGRLRRAECLGLDALELVLVDSAGLEQPVGYSISAAGPAERAASRTRSSNACSACWTSLVCRSAIPPWLAIK
jgi:hypothetical protein